MAVYGLARSRGPARETAELALAAESPEELLVDWINELVFRVGTEHWAPRRIAFAAAEERRLKASLSGERISGELAVEVKAATYHGLEVRRARGLWTATVILDV